MLLVQLLSRVSCCYHLKDFLLHPEAIAQENVLSAHIVLESRVPHASMHPSTHLQKYTNMLCLCVCVTKKPYTQISWVSALWIFALSVQS
jgi:hypothetical protein